MPILIEHSLPIKKHEDSQPHQNVETLPNNFNARQTHLVNLTYSQACLMPDGTVKRSLNTNDTGYKRRVPKRYYNWYSSIEDINNNPRSTKNMLERAERQSDLIIQHLDRLLTHESTTEKVTDK